MKILIVVATWMEANLIAEEFIFKGEKSHVLKHYQFNEIEIDILISGIGSTFTTFHLTQTLNNHNYSMVLNIGIAGSFTEDLQLGEVVNVVSEEFADLGIEKKDDFLTLFESGFLIANEFPFEQGISKATGSKFFNGLKKVKGITTNKSHGRERSITEIKEKFSAQVESMEGAAVFYVCSWLGINYAQIRAISNYVEPRVSSKWNIPLALVNLKNAVLKAIPELQVPIN